MGRKEALTQFHREAIAATADRMFQEVGIEKTTMDDIARQAEYSKRTIYAYFKSKDDIYLYIVRKAMNMMHDRIHDGIAAESSPVKQYYAICRELSSFAEKYPFYYQSLMDTIAVDPASRKANPILEEIYQMGEQIIQSINSMLDDGIKQGIVRQDARGAQVGMFFWAALSGVIMLANSKEQYIQQNTELSKHAFLDYSFHALLRAVLSEGEIPND